MLRKQKSWLARHKRLAHVSHSAVLVERHFLERYWFSHTPPGLPTLGSALWGGRQLNGRWSKEGSTWLALTHSTQITAHSLWLSKFYLPGSRPKIPRLISWQPPFTVSSRFRPCAQVNWVLWLAWKHQNESQDLQCVWKLEPSKESHAEKWVSVCVRLCIDWRVCWLIKQLLHDHIH